MARIVYQDTFITEYDDGTEDVRFTDDEWERMLSDPAYGYVCEHGHRLNGTDHQYIVVQGICPHCEAEADREYYANHPDEEML